MNASIRLFTDGDYAPVVALSNRVYPEYPETEGEWRYRDAHREAKIRHARWVAEGDGMVLGCASHDQWESTYHPQRFSVDVLVDPAYRRRGIGTRLYDVVVDALRVFDPIGLRAGTREDMTDGVRFVERRGFEECMRSWESRLDLAAFDPQAFEAEVARGLSGGLRVATLADLANDQDRERKLFALVDTVARDVPSPDEHTRPDFDAWCDRLFGNPNLIPELYTVAVDGNRYVALTNMWASQADPREVYTGLTGTLPEYRRRGLATAIKVATLATAKELGYRVTKTWNATINEGMLAINARLGFVRQPAWIEFAKALSPS